MREEKLMFSDTGLHGHHLYPLKDVAKYLASYWLDWEYPLPTEVVVYEAGLFVPRMGRVYGTHLHLPPIGDESSRYFPRAVAAEVYEDEGDDGHTRMVLQGIIFMHEDKFRELRKRVNTGEPLDKWGEKPAMYRLLSELSREKE